MSNTKFDANTQGIGELITQRKSFAVPLHQRSYSWGVEEVEDFLNDIENAFNSDEPEYFIGLMVLQGPIKGTWTILDGQQRLTTVTMIYSAVRNWLSERDYKADSEQIQAEYLGVRQLGGEVSARVRLNAINHALFDKHIVKNSPATDLDSDISTLSKKTSNFFLLDAALKCRLWVARFASSISTERDLQAVRLFQLSDFLATKVNIVSLDVTNETDAFILFEALNNRGSDLSALDLVKNHIFSLAQESEFLELESRWEILTQLIQNTNADDFLKYFWTSRFGIVQKTNLFAKIRLAFQSADEAQTLLPELIQAADFASAITDSSNQVWLNFSMDVRREVNQITVIGSKQARPLLYSAFKNLAEPELIILLKLLITALVRFQMIGHGRTGVMEKVFGKLSPMIWSGNRDQTDYISTLDELITSDTQFRADFFDHFEPRSQRAFYILSSIEKFHGVNPEALIDAKPIYLNPIHLGGLIVIEYKKIGSYFLLEKDLALEFTKATRGKNDFEIAEIAYKIFSRSQFDSTRFISPEWTVENVDHRTLKLADSAVLCWPNIKPYS